VVYGIINYKNNNRIIIVRRIMEDNEYAYEYAHDGGIYIGCKYNDYDCKEYDMWKVDCTKCSVTKELNENTQ
jgi:hypothetical protein